MEHLSVETTAGLVQTTGLGGQAGSLAASVNYGNGTGVDSAARTATFSIPPLEVTISSGGYVFVGSTKMCHIFRYFRIITAQYAWDAMSNVDSPLVCRIDEQSDEANRVLAPLMPVLASGVKPDTLEAAGMKYCTAMIGDIANTTIFVDFVKTHLPWAPALLALDQKFEERYRLQPK